MNPRETANQRERYEMKKNGLYRIIVFTVGVVMIVDAVSTPGPQILQSLMSGLLTFCAFNIK